MPLESFTNTFAGNPLDRVSDKRSDSGWIADRLSAPGSLAVALWNGKPLLETGKETAVFAVDLESEADPAEDSLAGLGRFEDLRAVAAALPGADAAIVATAKAMFEWRRRHRFCANCGHASEPAEGGWKRVCPSC